MKKYIKITNKKTVHRLLLEIIGLGTKRKSDKSKAGQWASGFKLATIAALRLGIKVAAASADVIGPFILKFNSRKIEVEQEGELLRGEIIIYKYSDGRKANTRVSLEAFSEWSSAIGDNDNNLYPILREYIANARDEDRNFAMETGVSEIRQADPGTTSVYVEETPEALEIVSGHSNRYFKFFGEMPVFRVVGIGAIYPKSSSDETRFFNDGYLVDCKKDDEFNGSLFDYDAYGKDIVNELRTIKDDCVFYRRLAKLFTRIRDKNLLRQIINFACDNLVSSVEKKILERIDEQDMSDDFKKTCREIWEEINGEKCLLACGDEAYDSYMRALGYKVISFGYSVNSFFGKAGIQNSKTAYKERFGSLKFRVLSETESARLGDVVKRCLMRIRPYNEIIFKCPILAMNDPMSNNRGLCANDYSVVCLADNIFFDEDIDFLGTICHEFDHYETRLHDSDYIKLMRHKDRRNARNLILLGIALNTLENSGIDISTLHPDFVSTKKSR